MVKKPSLSIHIELYILSQTTNIEEISSLSFILEKLSSLTLVSMGSKGKGFRFEKGKIFWAEGKKSARTPMCTKQILERKGTVVPFLSSNLKSIEIQIIY